MLSRVGDVIIDANSTINNSDAAAIISNVAKFGAGYNSLFKFRIADVVVDLNRTVNNADATRVTSNVITPDKLPKFYNSL